MFKEWEKTYSAATEKSSIVRNLTKHLMGKYGLPGIKDNRQWIHILFPSHLQVGW